MPDIPRMIYWDSSVFLHDIEGTPEWMSILDALIDEASRAGSLVIVTSTLSIVEVAYAKAEKSGKALDPAVVAGMDALWGDRSAVQLVEFDQVIARDARGLLRRSIEIGRKLTPPDAVHLATAAIMNVSDCQTTDGSMKKWSDLG
ncbi:MAG: PIN domain-containing protein, partial [Chloroflexia bacterium]|nr:PIN domain-containing protein [Chloroflexia bacterium]